MLIQGRVHSGLLSQIKLAISTQVTGEISIKRSGLQQDHLIDSADQRVFVIAALVERIGLDKAFAEIDASLLEPLRQRRRPASSGSQYKMEPHSKSFPMSFTWAALPIT